ncbi:hypothetical protein ACFLZ9_00780 [Patescibacteria group bacterium]
MKLNEIVFLFKSDKILFTLLILIIIFSISGLVVFYWPEKAEEITVKEQCLRDGIPPECENMEIWECHAGTFGENQHCHKICNEINKENCAYKICILNNYTLGQNRSCLSHMH